ncbi:hypothetical protein FPSE5266_10956 [Fusarium pseudograminearum]|nr:hypothetical protein FPSE5266_10956 [Fusarium pseudograminearum]
MSSSGSSFTSSSLGRPPTYGRTYVSPVDSTWTPTSGISTISAPTTEGSGIGTSVLDLGPPGFQATMILFQDTPDERVVYLGPWEVVGSEQRRVLWQGSYQNELLEHYLPSDVPSDIYPHTLHSRHRPYYDASDMERYLTFQEPHRVRYTTDEGVCIHDQYVTIRYEFTTVESSIRFQGDLRRKDLIDFYDADVVWTNVHGRTDGFGKVKGIGAIQRLKLWRDRYTTFHSLSVFANKTDGQYREYDIHCFDASLNITTSTMKVILAINAGSSSVKISVYTADKNAEPRQIAEASVGGLTAPPATLAYSRGSEKVLKAKEVSESVKTQGDAFDLILKIFIDDRELKEISSKEDIAIASHRIVHGGDYDRSQVITQDTYHHLEELSDLAPLHNGVALSIVDTCISALPSTVNVACFDSQFHQTLPPHIYTYPIDPKIAKSNRLRKYGFHGISYAFITRSVANYLQKDVSSLNMIALHLGSGASACAIKGGKSWDTSMGLTPLAGLPGATRSGSVDPSLVFHYASDVGKLSPASTKHLHISRAEEILNKESGWKSMTGTTNFGVVADSDEPSHRLAFDIFVDRIAAFVGSYFVTLEGRVDALVFAGGIGEHSAKLRSAVVNRVACLGFALNDASNQEPIKDIVHELGERDASQRVLVCQTDEQLEMARLCAEKEDIWE